MTSDFEYALVVVITIYLFYVFVIVAGRGYKQEINNNGWEEYYGGIYAP